MFIGRKQELDKLQELYHSGGFQLSVIYGRRRVGKTALINEFIKDKPVIFFSGMESNARQNLGNLSRSILSYTGASLEQPLFPSFPAALEYVFKLAENERLILVIDEYPYLAKAYNNIAATLQTLIDNNQENSRLFVILCGSSMSIMENHILAHTAPLYASISARLSVRPFDFFDSRHFFKNFSPLDLAAIYGIVGGTPQYLRQIDDNLSPAENIKRCFLDTASPLFAEPANLLRQEVREPANYNAIIAAIAAGNSKLCEISAKTGEETSSCATYVKNLISLGIISKETPLAQNRAKKTIYSISDNLFHFWYRFIPDNIAALNRGLTDDVYNKISPQISNYMGDVFAEICRQYLWRQKEQGRAAIAFSDLGRWWGNDAKNKGQVKIDIIGTDGANAALFGECKWTNNKVDADVLKTLVDRSHLLHYQNVQLYLFAKRGFTKGCIEKANELGNVALIDFAEIFQG